MVVKKLLGLFVIFLIGFLARPCDAVLLYDGQELKKWCKFIETKSADIQSNFLNAGFVAGVVDWRSLTNSRGFCDIPNRVNLKQVALVVDKSSREA